MSKQLNNLEMSVFCLKNAVILLLGFNRSRAHNIFRTICISSLLKKSWILFITARVPLGRKNHLVKKKKKKKKII